MQGNAFDYSEDAQKDLERLHDFLVVRDTEVARRAGTTIATHIARLQQYPELVPVVKDNYRLRSVPFGKHGYSVAYVYRAETDTVLVLGIRHQKEEFFSFEMEGFSDSSPSS